MARLAAVLEGIGKEVEKQRASMAKAVDIVTSRQTFDRATTILEATKTTATTTAKRAVSWLFGAS